MSAIAVPSPVPSPSEDAEGIWKALQGWRADKEALVLILTRRTAAQRAAIRRAYSFLYREPLLNCFRHRLSRHCLLASVDFWKAMIMWTMDPAERDANLAHGALRLRGDGGENDHISVLVEISCASVPDHLVAVRRAYAVLFGCSLEEDLAAASSFQDPLKKLLLALVTSYRYGGGQVDEAMATAEAALLCEAIRRKKQPHGEEVVRIVSTRSKAQLAATFRLYRDHHGTDVVEDIETRCSSQFAAALKSVVWCLTSPEKHFAEVIRNAVAGLGTYEDVLTRAVVSRAEVDMESVRAEYRARFGTTVAGDVAGDTSFGYRDVLLALVGTEEEEEVSSGLACL